MAKAGTILKEIMKGSTRILGILLLLLIGFALGRMTHRRGPEPTIITTVDSTSTVDSNAVVKPEAKDSTIICYVYIKVPYIPSSLLPENDSVPASNVSVPASQISSQDSVLVQLPIERKVYEEDSLYRAVISGYQCNLDSLTIYSTTTTITVHEKPPIEYRPYSWTLFPQAEVNYGAGALEMKASIGADISISENRRWRVEPEVGYRALLVNDQMLKGCYAGATIKYNLIQVK